MNKHISHLNPLSGMTAVAAQHDRLRRLTDPFGMRGLGRQLDQQSFDLNRAHDLGALGPYPAGTMVQEVAK